VSHPLVSRVLSGDTRAVARVCRAVDDRLPGYRDLLRELHPHTGRAWILGVTGSPGAGKSTLTDQLLGHLRASHERVAVIAVDPTSPFSGGAVLGDRIRMQRHFEDPGVFIRSVATRGALGGLSRSVSDLARVFDAWGAGVVLIETVGVGQDELDVTRAAHTTLVVVAPGLGDDVQAIKAGILEVADVFAVNKADRPGAEAAVRDLENMLALGALSLAQVSPPASHAVSGRHARRPGGGGAEPREGWTPPVQKTVGTTGEGVVQLVESLEAHRVWVESTEMGQDVRRSRAHAQLVAMLKDAVTESMLSRLGDPIREMADRVEARQEDPYTACERLIERFRT
jgi:LAO/AO transport system kinase